MSRLFSDESSEFLEVAAAPTINYPFTMSCWVYVDEDVDMTFMAVGDDTGGSADLWSLSYSAAINSAAFRSQDAGTASSATAPTNAISLNTWAHVVGWGSASNLRRCYVDGVAGGDAVGVSTPDITDHLTIGTRYLNSDGVRDSFMSGRIAECAIWNVALTAAEITALASRAPTQSIRLNALIFYAPLIGASPEPDYTAGQHHLTTISGTVVAPHPPVAQFLPWLPTRSPGTTAAAPAPRRYGLLLGVG